MRISFRIADNAYLKLTSQNSFILSIFQAIEPFAILSSIDFTMDKWYFL